MIRSATGGEPEWYCEDLAPGRRFDLGISVVDGTEMLAYARRFDPQWYHVDEQLARSSEFGGLIASGWFTVSLFMRAYVDRVLAHAAPAMSPGTEEVRWRAPVRAGDELSGWLEVVDRRPSPSRPGLGTVTLAGGFTRAGADVLYLRFRGWFGYRPATRLVP